MTLVHLFIDTSIFVGKSLTRSQPTPLKTGSISRKKQGEKNNVISVSNTI